MNDITEVFLEEFKKLERVTKQQYITYNHTSTIIGTDGKEREVQFIPMITDLKNRDIEPYKSNFDLIYYCANVGNVCQHNPRVNNSFIVQPNKLLYDSLRKIIYRIENPPKVSSIAIPYNKIYKKNLTDNVKDTIKVMKEKTYTHIPIYDNDIFIGVFSETTLFDCLYKEEIVEISNTTTFKDLLNYITFDNTSELIKFKSENTTITELKKEYKEEFKRNDKLSCIFITKNGNKNEKLLGMITAWDILGRED